jgi:signal transduction histidine kinase
VDDFAAVNEGRDIRTPTDHGRRAAAQFIRLGVEEDLPEAIGFIRSSTKKMDGLINAILKISRDGRRELKPERVNREALASGELELRPLESADIEIVTDLLTKHLAETDSVLAAKLLADPEAAMAAFVKVLPRDYAAVLKTRQDALDEGLDPDGDVVWSRIMEVTGG